MIENKLTEFNVVIDTNLRDTGRFTNIDEYFNRFNSAELVNFSNAANLVITSQGNYLFANARIRKDCCMVVNYRLIE